MALKEILRDAGIVGAGGAGFPTYAKLAKGADTVLINAAECEPLLFTDFTILSRALETVCDGARLLADELQSKDVLLCIKAHNAEELGYEDGAVLPYGVKLRALPDIYPLGDEITLIYEATGRLVAPGCLPITEGVVVSNTETVYNIARAVREGKPLTEKWLTVGGDIPEPRVLRVPIGMPVSELLCKLNIKVPETHVVLDGGPAMGKVIKPATASVTKTTKGIVILPREIPAVQMKLRRPNQQATLAASACCQCTNCTEMCPRALLGYPLEPHRLVRGAEDVVRAKPEAFATAQLCCGCGICEISACGQFISPKAMISRQKAILAEHKLRYTSDKKVTPSPDKDARRVPSSRWRSLLGVSRFHREAPYVGFVACDEVKLPMRMHIGAPAIPAVKIGDTVKEGDLIATAADGLSLPHHAPISGRVAYLDDNSIHILRDGFSAV